MWANLFGWSLQADAGSISVTPTRLDLSPGQSAGSVTVVNDGDEPIMIQVETFAWSDGTTTADLDPTREIVAVPPLSRLKPGEKQIIRVAKRGVARTDSEETYRLLLTEVPQSDGNNRGGVRFALRLSLPLFITPPTAEARPSWTIEKASGGPVLQVANSGNAHLLVRRLEISGGGAKAPTVVDTPSYILAGRQQQWSLDHPALRGLNALKIRAQTNLGDLDLVLPASGR